LKENRATDEELSEFMDTLDQGRDPDQEIDLTTLHLSDEENSASPSSVNSGYSSSNDEENSKPNFEMLKKIISSLWVTKDGWDVEIRVGEYAFKAHASVLTGNPQIFWKVSIHLDMLRFLCMYSICVPVPVRMYSHVVQRLKII
jgi:hypothetical protein